MKTANLEKREDLGEFLYHLRELLEVRDRVDGLIERLDSSLGRDTDATETVVGEARRSCFSTSFTISANFANPSRES